MDDRTHEDEAAMQHHGGRIRGMRQGSGSSSRSISPASTQILDWGQNDSLPSGYGEYVHSDPEGSDSPGESRDTGVPDQEPAEQPVLRAWFNVVAGVGEITGPEMRAVIRDPHAFMTCMTMSGLFAQQGFGAPFLAGYISEAQESEGAPGVSVMSETGRVVTISYNMRTGRGTVCHPRGRVDLEDPNDIWVQVTYRIVGPAVRLARERDRWHLRRDGVPVQLDEHGDEPWGRDWPLDGDDQEAIEFLRTQYMIAADDELEEDREAMAFIGSHNFAAIQTASARQVTVTRDEAGWLQGIQANDRSRYQMNYSTVNQDEELGRWAEVEPFSAAGARAALDAILLPSIRSQRGPVMLEIAPMRSNLPGMLTMQTGFVVNPWSPEGLRSAFRLMQAVARGRYPRTDPGGPPSDSVIRQPAVTIMVVIERG